MGFFDFLSPVVSAVGSLVGGKMSSDAVSDANANNAAFQKEAMQHGIKWRVDDAKAAGVNPLFALGAPTFSPSPSFVGDTGMGEGFARAGQDLSRAMDATRTREERINARLDALKIQRAELENSILASQLAKSTATNPPFPTLGDSGQVSVVPSERTSTLPGQPATEAAVSPATKLFRNRDGSITVWPSNDAKQATEDNFIYEMEHVLRNRVFPFFKDWWNDEVIRRR